MSEAYKHRKNEAILAPYPIKLYILLSDMISDLVILIFRRSSLFFEKRFDLRNIMITKSLLHYYGVVHRFIVIKKLSIARTEKVLVSDEFLCEADWKLNSAENSAGTDH